MWRNAEENVGDGHPQADKYHQDEDDVGGFANPGDDKDVEEEEED